MARKKFSLQFKGWEETMEKLDEVGGSNAMKRGVESGLRSSKNYVNQELKRLTAKSNLPAKGKYSGGDLRNSIDTDMEIDWKGLEGSIKVGFDFSKSGMVSIFMLYGTPKHAPVAGLYEAIYGQKTTRKITKLQEEAIQKVIKRIMEGK